MILRGRRERGRRERGRREREREEGEREEEGGREGGGREKKKRTKEKETTRREVQETDRHMYSTCASPCAWRRGGRFVWKFTDDLVWLIIVMARESGCTTFN